MRKYLVSVVIFTIAANADCNKYCFSKIFIRILKQSDIDKPILFVGHEVEYFIAILLSKVFGACLLH